MSHSAIDLATVAPSIANRARRQSQRWLQYTFNNSNRTKNDNLARASAVYWIAHHGEGDLYLEVVEWLSRLEEERKDARLAAGTEEGAYVEDCFGAQAGRRGKKKAKGETEETHREEADDEESEDRGDPIVTGRIFLSPTTRANFRVWEPRSFAGIPSAAKRHHTRRA